MFVGDFFRTRNIHTLYSPVYLCICVDPLSVWQGFGAFCNVCGRLLLERGVFTHLFRLFFCVIVLDSSLAFTVTSRL